jgi:magnesium-transporting ATPase (P-type)
MLRAPAALHCCKASPAPTSDERPNSLMNRSWHAMPIDDVAAELGSSLSQGLTPSEAAARLQRDGPNEIRKARRESPFVMFLRQFGSVVIWVLIAAAAVSSAWTASR